MGIRSCLPTMIGPLNTGRLHLDEGTRLRNNWLGAGRSEGCRSEIQPRWLARESGSGPLPEE
jgi:hypothetical protein